MIEARALMSAYPQLSAKNAEFQREQDRPTSVRVFFGKLQVTYFWNPNISAEEVRRGKAEANVGTAGSID